MSASETKSGKVVVRLSVSLEILDVIGEPDDRNSIAVGTGRNTGCIRLRKNPAGAFAASILGRGRVAVFNLGATDFAPASKQKSTVCEFRPAGDAALKIELPTWTVVLEIKAAA